MSYSLVTHAIGGSTDNSSVTTNSVNTTGANFIIAMVTCGTSFGPTNVVTDSKSNNWIYLGHSTTVATPNNTILLFYTIPTSVGAAHTFLFNAAGQFPALAVCAFSGDGLASNLSGFSGTGITSYQLGSISSTPHSTGLAVTAIGFSNSETMSIDNGFTISDQLDTDGAHHIGIAMAYKIDPTGTVNPTWSWGTNNTFNFGIMLALFDKVASGGSGSGGSYVFG